MPWEALTTRRARDPGFCDTILRIYEHRCAVCGYDGRLGSTVLGIEAAHVKWHSAGGPDSPDNGLALCTFHHKALDRGAIGIADDHAILVSQEVHGSQRVDEMLIGFSGEHLRQPQPGQPLIERSFSLWHREQVFHGPARAPVPR